MPIQGTRPRPATARGSHQRAVTPDRAICLTVANRPLHIAFGVGPEDDPAQPEGQKQKKEDKAGQGVQSLGRRKVAPPEQKEGAGEQGQQEMEEPAGQAMTGQHKARR